MAQPTNNCFLDAWDYTIDRLGRLGSTHCISYLIEYSFFPKFHWRDFFKDHEQALLFLDRISTI